MTWQEVGRACHFTLHLLGGSSAASQSHPESANVLVSVPEERLRGHGNLDLKAVSINAVCIAIMPADGACTACDFRWRLPARAFHFAAFVLTAHGSCLLSQHVLCPGLCTQVHVRSTANSGAVCQVRPTQLALACSDQYVRVFDRRMLSVGTLGPCAAVLHAAVPSWSSQGLPCRRQPEEPGGCSPWLQAPPAPRASPPPPA